MPLVYIWTDHLSFFLIYLIFIVISVLFDIILLAEMPAFGTMTQGEMCAAAPTTHALPELAGGIVARWHSDARGSTHCKQRCTRVHARIRARWPRLLRACVRGTPSAQLSSSTPLLRPSPPFASRADADRAPAFRDSFGSVVSIVVFAFKPIIAGTMIADYLLAPKERGDEEAPARMAYGANAPPYGRQDDDDDDEDVKA
jgi:hypothetical protein